MKCLLIFSVVFVVVNALSSSEEFVAKWKEDFHNHINECKEEVNPSAADVQQIMHHITPASHSGKCLLACAAKKCEILDESGHVNAEKMKEKAEELKDVDQDFYEKMSHIFETCVDHVQNDDDECETAANMFSCINKGIRDADLQRTFQ